MCQSITKRIKFIIENEKLSLTSFSHKTGIARTTLQSMFEKGTNPSFDLLTKVIGAFPSYSIGWIFTGKGEILLPQQSELQIDFLSEPKTKSTPTQSSVIDYKEKRIEPLEETVKERLKKYLSDNNISQSSFCQAIEVGSGYISSMRVSIQPDKLYRIAIKYPSLNIGWLLTGVGNMNIPISSSNNISEELISLRAENKLLREIQGLGAREQKEESRSAS